MESPSASPLIIAHRGASADAPENTLAAFRLGWRQDADGIEGDFSLTADDRIVAIHDDDTRRVAGRSCIVRDRSFDELRTLDVGAWKGESWRGETIPSIEEVLAVVPPGKKLFIELKAGPEIAAPLGDVLAHLTLNADQIVIISLDADTIAVCKHRMPQFRHHWLTCHTQLDDGNWLPSPEDVIATIRQIHADGLGSEAKPERFNDDFVQELRSAGIHEFHLWTVDSPAVALFYQRLGAWSITTNRPAALRAELTALDRDD